MAYSFSKNGEFISSNRHSHTNSAEHQNIRIHIWHSGDSIHEENRLTDDDDGISPFQKKMSEDKKWSCITTLISIFLIILIIFTAILIVCLTIAKPNKACHSSFQSILADNSLNQDSKPCCLASGDLNQDNFTDIVVVNSGANRIGIFFNYGNDSFSSPTVLPTGEYSQPVAVTLADFNNDKYLDIATANYDSHTIGIFLGYGNGSFADQILFSTDASRPLWLAVGHFNNDSWLDIVGANNGTHSISVIFGYGNGSFGKQITYSTNYDSFPYSVDVADFNNDSHLDIVVANYGTDSIGVFFGYGNGSFHQQIIYATNLGSHPYSVATGDFDNDKNIDIAVANSGTNTIGIFLNHGNGTFRSSMSYSASPGSNPRSIVVADFDQDNQMDIAISNYLTDNIGILIGLGNGSFVPPTIHSTGTDSGPFGLTAADFNNDNQTDIAVTNYDLNNIVVLTEYTMMQSEYPMNYSTGIGSNPNQIVTADLNNDTELDLIVTNSGTNLVGIFFGYGNGSFQEQITYSSGTGSHPYGLAIRDLDSDKNLDIVVGNSNTETLGIFYGHGNGTFDTVVPYFTGKLSSITAITINDFNNDNHLDIAFSDFGTNSIGLLYGYENRIYINLTHYPAGDHSRPWSLAAGDINNDGRLDITVANFGTSNIAICLGTNNDTFILFAFYSTGDNSLPRMVILIDLNNDDYLDIIVANTYSWGVGVFFGYGDGTFTTQILYSTSSITNPYYLAVADFNNDDILDIAVANVNIDKIGILLGNGSGYFGNQSMYPTGPNSQPFSLTTGDFNKDNRLDIAVANSGSNSIALLLGHPIKDSTNTTSNRTNSSSQSFSVPNGIPILLGEYYATFRSKLTYLTGFSSHPYSIDIGDINNDSYMDIIVANSGIEYFGLMFGIGNGSFYNEIFHPLGDGSYPQNVLVNDFNNDHRLDIAVTDPRNDNIIIFLTTDNGTFSTNMTYATGLGSIPTILASANLNNDNYVDLIVVNKGTDTVGIFFGYDYTIFTSETLLENQVAIGPTSIVAGDINNDGHLDVVATFYGTDSVGVLLGYGDGTFAPMIICSNLSSSHPWSVQIGDVNNDNHSDIIVANWGVDNVGVILGYGNGSFTDPLLFTTGLGSRPVVVALADFNNDHYLDIITANYGGNSIGILIGYGNGTFKDIVIYPTGDGSFPSSVTVSDTNNDTYLDLIVANQGSNNIGVFLGYGNGSFAEQIISSTGDNSARWFTSTFDPNNDGRLDIVVTNYGTSAIGILYGYGNGSFGNIQTYSTGIGSNPIMVKIADINNDNLLDIVVSDEVRSSLGIFFGYRDGTFSSMSIVPVPGNNMIYGFVFGNFNNDSYLDIVVADYGDNKLEILFQFSNKPFGGQDTFSMGKDSSPSAVAIGHLNNDNHLDIVTANSGTNNIGILFGYGNRSFSDISTYSTGNNSQPLSLAIGDFNNDSRTDIVVANSNTDDIVIFIGDGNGNFSPFKTYPMGNNARPVSVTIAYLNKDSQLDIIVANYGTNNVYFLFGSGDGTFTNETYYPLGYGSRPNWIVAQDLNNDGRQDIAVVTYGTDNIQVLLNIC